MYKLKMYLAGIILFLCFCGNICGQSREIPYPEALKAADIEITNLNDILDGALIIGNGDINALVYAGDDELAMNLTKNDVWDARVLTENDPPIPTLDLIKQLGASDTAFPLRDNNRSYVLPEGKSWDKKDSYHTAAYPCPRQCARLFIAGAGNSEKLQGRINLHKAAARIEGPVSGPVEIRALADRNIFLINTIEKVTLEPVRSEDLPEAILGKRDNLSWLTQEIPGDPDWPGMAFSVVVASSESMKAVAIVTSRESGNHLADAISLAEKTLLTDEKTLIENHQSAWDKFWSQSGVEMRNKFLQSMWYRSVYFLRCVSKPGVQSVGLFAGLINDVPAWHGDYHTNYNIQQTYWSAYPANHGELATPYDKLMSDYLTRAKWLSEKVFSMDGAYYPHVLYAYEPEDPALCRSRNGRQYIHHVWGMTLGVNGFSIQPMWWRYKYDPDPIRLEEVVYPVLREVAVFYAEFIEQCEGDGSKILGPTVSPEHWGWTKNLDRNYNCTFDIALIRYTLNAAIEAANTLGTDKLLVERLEGALQLLPDYPQFGEEEPVIVDVEGAPPIEYNIPVPSTPVFPGDVVTWWSPEEEKKLFERTIAGLKWNGNNATFMLAIARARLSMPESEQWLEREVKARTRSNATLSLNRLVPHQRFNDFGHYTEQFGVGMAISELLIQSVGDIIRIFPALAPGNYTRFRDLRVQGGFLVAASGSSDNVQELHITSLYGGPLKLLSPWKKISAGKNDQNYTALKTDARGVVKLQTKPGDTWRFINTK